MFTGKISNIFVVGKSGRKSQLFSFYFLGLEQLFKVMLRKLRKVSKQMTVTHPN